MPVLFHRATAVQVLDEEVDDGREVMVLAHASTPAFIARQDTNIDNLNNPTLVKVRQASSYAWTTRNRSS